MLSVMEMRVGVLVDKGRVGEGKGGSCNYLCRYVCRTK
jgi:hypothetical protein